MSGPVRGARAVKVFLCFAAGYLLSYALRSVNAVIAPALVAELNLSNSELGLLSSAYFISFALVQLPLGIWLDRYGPRRIEAGLLLCAALGAAVFASSTSLAGLWCGRALIGLGVSACLMAAFKAFRQWFPAEQQSQLASWMLVAGTSGALSATLPVSTALPLIGWRGIFWIVAGALLLVSSAIFFLLREVETAHGATSPSAPGDGGYGPILRHPYFIRMAPLGLLNHGIFFALQTLWVGPWLSSVAGKTPEQTSQILFLFNLVLMLAYLSLGAMAPRMDKRGWNPHHLIALGLAGSIGAGVALLYGHWTWWLLLALCMPVTTLVQSHLALAFPASQAGRVNSAYNLQLFVGAFAAQWGIGILADSLRQHGANPQDALRGAFAAMLVLQTLALFNFLIRRS